TPVAPSPGLLDRLGREGDHQVHVEPAATQMGLAPVPDLQASVRFGGGHVDPALRQSAAVVAQAGRAPDAKTASPAPEAVENERPQGSILFISIVEEGAGMTRVAERTAPGRGEGHAGRGCRVARLVTSMQGAVLPALPTHPLYTAWSRVCVGNTMVS